MGQKWYFWPIFGTTFGVVSMILGVPEPSKWPTFRPPFSPSFHIPPKPPKITTHVRMYNSIISPSIRPPKKGAQKWSFWDLATLGIPESEGREILDLAKNHDFHDFQFRQNRPKPEKPEKMTFFPRLSAAKSILIGNFEKNSKSGPKWTLVKKP